METPDFIHRFEPAPDRGGSTRALLLLHGTGGNESDLLPVGRALDPTAALLSPRGQVLENGMPRFFRRLAEGVFDEKDVIKRAGELAKFVRAAADEYQLDLGRMVAVGYSNGANIAAAILLLGLAPFRSALLFRAMVPLLPEHLPSLTGSRVLVSSGLRDPIVPPANAQRLVSLLREGGADAELKPQPAGHELTSRDLDDAREWLGRA